MIISEHASYAQLWRYGSCERGEPKNIQVGDITAFKVPRPYNNMAPSPIIHRVIDKIIGDGNIYFKQREITSQTKIPGFYHPKT
jgi:hypothetical protein